jgi:hypothetical protein
VSPAVSGRIVDNRETDAVREGRSGDHRRRRLFRQRANRSNGYYYSSHVAAGNKIYLASEEGVVVYGPILATPAIVDGKISCEPKTTSMPSDVELAEKVD